MTPTRDPARDGTTHGVGAYVVCLDCGQEFTYNWVEMRVGPVISASSLHGSSLFSNSLVTEETVAWWRSARILEILRESHFRTKGKESQTIA